MTDESDRQHIGGVAVAEGYAVGTARLVDVAHYPSQVPHHTIPEEDVNGEISRLRTACAEARKELEGMADRVEEEVSRREAEMIRPQAAIAEDPTFIAEAEEIITEENVNAEAAVAEVMDRFENIMESLEDDYLRERSTDVRDVGRRILSNLLFVDGELTPELSEPCIVVSSHLVPSLTVHLDRENILGFATERGGYTSHAAILARSLGIPAVTGLDGLTEEIVGGEQLVVDGQSGAVIIDPTPEELSNYERKAEQYRIQRRKMESEAARPGVTTDGKEITIQGNIGRPADLNVALEHDVNGIGLYRTEFNYLSRSTLPKEDEIAREYKRVVSAFGEKGVRIRILDIGGDKYPPSIPLAHEENPFLGLRGLRLMLEHQDDLMLPQLRAILRASQEGKVSVLYPMVTSYEELEEARKVFEKAVSQVREAGYDIRDDVQQGIMIEVPSCIPVLPELFEICDYATIGTNDLVQYSIAADRNSERMVDYYDPCYPSIIRMLQEILEIGEEAGASVGICGETASDLNYLPVLMGMGYTQLSANVQVIPQIRHFIRNVSASDCEELAQKVLAAKKRDTVHELAEDFRKQQSS